MPVLMLGQLTPRAMAAIPRALSLLVAAPLLFACENPTTTSSTVMAAARVAETSSLVLHETGYTARVVANGLNLPQGTVELGNGVMFVNATGTGEIVRVLPSGAHAIFAAIPPPPVPGYSVLLDLIFDPGRGLFASTLRAPRATAFPVWQVGMNGNTTPFGAVNGFQSFLALDNAGRLYVAQIHFGVARIDLDGSVTRVVSLLTQPTPTVRGITLDEQGRLYVLTTGRLLEQPVKTRIHRFDLVAAPSLPLALAAGELITDDLPAPTDGWLPVQDLLFWPKGGGDLFTVDPGNVYRVKLDGTISIFASGLTDTVAGNNGVFNTLALSGAGDLLVTEYSGGRVTRIKH